MTKNERAVLEQGVVSYLPLVRQVVARLARRLPANVERDDLVAAGVCGLVDCLKRSGGGSGSAFEWYARTRIRGAIFDELRAQDWLSRRARASATIECGASFVSIEDVCSGGDDPLLAERDFRDVVEERSTARALAHALTLLPDRERIVVGRYYFEERRLKDISAELGVSEPRIYQLLTRAVRRLRVLLGAPSLGEGRLL